MIIGKFETAQGMIENMQSLKDETKLNFYQNIGNYFDEMNIRRQSGTFQFGEDVFAGGAQGISKIYHEVLLLMKILQNKPQITKMIYSYYDLC